MKIFNKLTLKNKLIMGCIILFSLCLTGIYFGLYKNTIKNMETQLKSSLEIVTKQTGDQIDSIFSDMNTVSYIIQFNKNFALLLSNYDKDYLIQLSDYWQLQEALDSISAYFSNLDIEIYLNNKSLLSYEKLFFYDNDKAKSKPWYRETIDRKGAPYWTNNTTYDTSYFLDIPAISNIKVMEGIYLPEDEQKILKISTSQKAIKDILDEAVQNLPIQTYLADYNGNVMISNSKDAYLRRIDGWAAENDSGEFKTIINNKQMLVIYRRIESNNWYVVSVIPTDYYNNMLLSKQGLFWTGMAVLFVIFICASLIMAGSINHRINNISDVLTNIEQKNFEEMLIVENRDELSKLEVRINKFIGEIQLLMKNIKAVEKAKRKSEMSVLQAQIKPHFIYNTLDAINWMALDSGQFEISKTVVNLALFIRMSLHGGRDIVSVKDELEHVKMYVAIIQARSDCDIELVTDVDERILDKAIIKFILQPIVENAVIHGFIDRHRDKGKIIIKGELNDNCVRISVIDDGAGFNIEDFKQKTREHKSLGLKNIEERLNLYFDNQAQFIIESAVDKGTIVLMEWPEQELNE
jgi:two-component system, sensor histidine kinase YesM